MNTIKQFCEERKLSKPIEDAFIMYCRSTYAERFMLKSEGSTIGGLIEKISKDDINRLWIDFIREIKNILI